MATVMEAAGNLTTRPRYDWDNWLDGRRWLLVRGVDFSQAIRSFRGYAFTVAKQRGLRIATHVTKTDAGEDALEIQVLGDNA